MQNKLYAYRIKNIYNFKNNLEVGYIITQLFLKHVYKSKTIYIIIQVLDFVSYEAFRKTKSFINWQKCELDRNLLYLTR